ncbi:MAG: hypothetical protein GY832_36990 [Chloroflexi bacterium]|nr:hypothetical protein [Chloroflexota bacterium]
MSTDCHEIYQPDLLIASATDAAPCPLPRRLPLFCRVMRWLVSLGRAVVECGVGSWRWGLSRCWRSGLLLVCPHIVTGAIGLPIAADDGVVNSAPSPSSPGLPRECIALSLSCKTMECGGGELAVGEWCGFGVESVRGGVGEKRRGVHRLPQESA